MIGAENQLYGLQDRRKRLESNKSDRKVPNGLKIHSVTAKGLKNVENLQQKFNMVIKEAELTLLDATIEALQMEEQQTVDQCTEEKAKVLNVIDNWNPLWILMRANSSNQRKASGMTFTSSAPQHGLLSGWQRSSKRLQKPQKARGKWRRNLP